MLTHHQSAIRHQWQTLLELIWSSRYDPIASQERRIALLQACLAIAIALAAGPEIFVAMEMTALMELLGAVLFLKAMAAGAQLVALNIWSAIYNFAFPIPPAAIVQPGASILAKALALIQVSAHAIWCVVMAVNCRCVGAWGHSAGRMLVRPPNNSLERTHGK